MDMDAMWEQMAELEARGELNSEAGLELQRVAEEMWKAQKVAQEDANDPFQQMGAELPLAAPARAKARAAKPKPKSAAAVAPTAEAAAEAARLARLGRMKGGVRKKADGAQGREQGRESAKQEAARAEAEAEAEAEAGRLARLGRITRGVRKKSDDALEQVRRSHEPYPYTRPKGEGLETRHLESRPKTDARLDLEVSAG
jgi:hypothetical protein